MTDTDRIRLYYAPQSRATAARVLLEELGAPYDLHVLNMQAGEQREGGAACQSGRSLVRTSR